MKFSHGTMLRTIAARIAPGVTKALTHDAQRLAVQPVTSSSFSSGAFLSDAQHLTEAQPAQRVRQYGSKHGRMAARHGLKQTGSGRDGQARARHVCGPAELTDVLLQPDAGAQDLSQGVVELSTDAEYDAAMKDVADKDARAVVDFTATWCGPCESKGFC